MNMVGRALGGKVGPLALIRREKRSEFFSPDQIPNHLVNFLNEMTWNELKWMRSHQNSPQRFGQASGQGGGARAKQPTQRNVLLWSLLDDLRCKINVRIFSENLRMNCFCTIATTCYFPQYLKLLPILTLESGNLVRPGTPTSAPVDAARGRSTRRFGVFDAENCY